MKYFDFPLENGQKIHHFEKFIKKIIKVNNNVDSFTVVISSVYEPYDWKTQEKTFIQSCYRILKKYKIKNYIYVVNSTYHEYRTPSNTVMKSVIDLEFFALMVYYRINYLKTEINQKWNSSAPTALLMTGKPNKINRIGLLGCFVDKELINRLDWSFYPMNDIPEFSKNSSIELKKFCKMDYLEFCKKYARFAGNVEILKNESSNHYSGFPYAVSLYSNNVLSVVSETCFSVNNRIWLTEKTWRPIANKHPFIIAGNRGSLQKLNKLGFKTFEKYLKYQNYDNTPDNYQKINYIVENTEYFLNNYQEHINEIEQDIEYNYNRFNELCKNEISRYPMFADFDFFNSFFKYRLNDY